MGLVSVTTVHSVGKMGREWGFYLDGAGQPNHCRQCGRGVGMGVILGWGLSAVHSPTRSACFDMMMGSACTGLDVRAHRGCSGSPPRLGACFSGRTVRGIKAGHRLTLRCAR